MNKALVKLRRWLTEKGLQGVVLTREGSVAWLFGGRYHIAVTTDMACVAVLVTGNTTEVLVNNIEAQRLQDEEGLTAEQVRVYSWYDEGERVKWISRWLANPKVAEESVYSTEIQSLRLCFDEDQIPELLALGRDVARALYSTVVELRPDLSENDAAGTLASYCLATGIEPIVNLVAGARRAPLYRHLLPTSTLLGRYAVLSVGGRRNGVVISATRMVCFGPALQELRVKYHAVLQVEAALLRASVVGAGLGSVLSSGIHEYAAQGYPNEWTHHHQGGVGGYLPREVRAMPEHSLRLDRMMMLAWNPTIRGVKAEDSVLLRETGLELLTVDEHYPTVAVGGGSLRLPDILFL